MGIDWVLGLALLLGGGVLGAVIGRLYSADSSREKRLAEELEQTQNDFKAYKSDVEAHFRETADAVNEMTESYRLVHEKLRAGASRLCGDSGPLLDLRPSPRLEQQTAAESAVEETSEQTAEVSAPEEPVREEAKPEEPDTVEAPAEQPGEAQEAPDKEAQSSGEAPVEEESPQQAMEAEAEAETETGAGAGAGGEAEGAAEETTITQPLDYAVDSEDEEREKTIH